jgi:hypothetical protein
MGGAVAIALTSHNAPKIRALVVENTFTSIPDLLSGRMPWCLKWIRYLCTQRWDSRGRIGAVPSGLPVLMLSGLRDTVVPAGDMRRLWGAAQRRHGGGGRWGLVRRLMTRRKTSGAEDGKRAETDMEGQETRDEFFTFEYGGHGSLPSISIYSLQKIDYLPHSRYTRRARICRGAACILGQNRSG